MSSEYICRRPQNRIIIIILQSELNKRRLHDHSPQLPVPFKKAMKAIAEFNFVVQNEWHAQVLDDIGDYLAQVIGDGLKRVGKYRRGAGQRAERLRAQDAIKEQITQYLRQRTNRRINPINRLYIPRANTATRAMFIVLGASRDAMEGGLAKHTIISRSRNYTNVDFNARYDANGLYDGSAGIKQLKDHEYVVKRNRLYHITEKGYNVYFAHCRPHQTPTHSNNNNRNNNRNNDDYDDGIFNTYVANRNNESVGGRQHNQNHNINTNNNHNYRDNDEQLQKAISESKISMEQKQNELSNLNDDNDPLLQRVLLESSEMTGNNKYDMALRVSAEQEEILNNIKKNKNNNGYKYWCPYCVSPRKKYKLKVHYEKHMQKHEMNSNNLNNSNNNNNFNDDYDDNIFTNYMNHRNIINNNDNSPVNNSSMLGKRKQYDGYDSDIQLLPSSISPPMSKKRKSVRNNFSRNDSDIQILPSSSSSPSMNRKRGKSVNNKYIKNDLDEMLKAFGLSYADAKKKHQLGLVLFRGKRYKLKLWIDTAEQNLSSTNINELDVLGWIQSKGINSNNCQYKKLANADYIFVISNENGENHMINFAVERKRWDDLEKSVLVDGRGNDQKKRLKLTPITRKYYLVEGKDKMIRDYDRRIKCKEFLQETGNKDGYMVKYTQSKHESMNKICEWYFKVLTLLNQENGCGDELVLYGYSFQTFQDSQRRNVQRNIVVNQNFLKQLKEMGFDENKCKQALIAVNNKSVVDALTHLMK